MTPTTHERELVAQRLSPPRLAAAALALGAVSGLGVLTTGAVFTSTTSSSGTLFTTGTVQLTATPTTAAMTMTGLSPGDVRYGRLIVQNTGTLGLRYAMTTTATDDGATTGDDRALAATLQVAARVVPPGSACDATTYGASGSTVATRATPQPLGGSAEVAVVGDKAQGAQAGDRPLGASVSENLCFQVTLPTAASDNLQGMRTSVTFTFFGEQTQNNP